MFNLDRRAFFAATAAVMPAVGSLGAAAALAAGATPEDTFRDPPLSAGPWVYWMWLDGNVTPDSVAADLKAMHDVCIAGAYILDVLQGTPEGPARYMDAAWQAAFRAATEVARRLGMQLIFNNGAGYYGSGGPWITPELSMQILVQSETALRGGGRVAIDLPRPRVPSDDPPATPWYADAPFTKTFGDPGADYRDIAVIAVREPPGPLARVADPSGMKLLTWYEWNGYTGVESAPADARLHDGARPVPRADVVDLSDRMRDGHLVWDAPPGDWTVFRIGHGGKGRIIGPVRQDKAGLESDKLSLAATECHFDAMIRPLLKAVGAVGRGTIRGTHIDSWEGGGQNWTPLMRKESTRRRGYDPVAWLPIVTGRRVIGDLQTTERFLWDLRRTVSELSVEHYWQAMKRLSNAAGLALSGESYTTIGNDLDASDASDAVDEPMAEFWKHTGGGFNGFGNTCKAMASAAHLNGRAIVAAEAFTSVDSERWQDHPGTLKAIGDANFAKGVNRLVFHRYSAQRFPGIAPGLQMGPWGLHYERTQTWWTMSRPWHVYIARCQHMLRRGIPVADVLRIPSEEPLLRVEDTPVPGFDYDHVGPDMLARARVKDGRVVFQSGASYRLLVLDHHGTMTLATLRHIARLLRDGAALLGERPRATPGLSDRVAADSALQALARDLWGATATDDRRHGAGRVFRGIAAQEALARMQIAPDLESDVPLAWAHRRDGDRDIYFLASDAARPLLANVTLRTRGRCELWNAEDGSVTRWDYAVPTPDGRLRMCVPLAAEGSIFVVVRPGAGDPIVAVDHDGRSLYRDGRGEAALLPLLAATMTAAEPGRYAIRRRDAAMSETVVAASPGATLLTRPWRLRFPPDRGAPAEATMATLHSLADDIDRGVAHFAGIATYRTGFAATPTPGQRLWLDLCRVEVAARVRLNGRDLGILWRAPYAIDVTDAVRAGENVLEVDVATTWINRLIGDEDLPADSERYAGGPGTNGRNAGSLKSWPRWVLEGGRSPTGRIAFSTWNLYRKGEPLVPSGLIGPVRLVVTAAPLVVRS